MEEGLLISVFSILVITSSLHSVHGNPHIRITVRRNEEIQSIPQTLHPSQRGKNNATRTLTLTSNEYDLEQLTEPQEEYIEIRNYGTKNNTARTHIATNNTEHIEEQCDTCKRLLQPPTIEELKRRRLESVKRNILNRLRMTHPPNVSNFSNIQHNLPDWTLDGMDDVNAEDYYAVTRESMAIAHKVYNCSQSDQPQLHSVCMKISLKNTDEYVDMESAKLFFRYRPFIEEDEEDNTRMLALYEVVNNHDNVLEFQTPEENQQWTSFNVKQTIDGLIAVKPAQSVELTFKITCITRNCPDLVEEFTTNKPFLQFIHNQSHRNKRELRFCDRLERQCCLAKYYVSFRRLKWDFILQPAGYWANFCSGKCENIFDKPAYQASRMLMSNHRPTDGVRMYRACCAPTQLSPLSIIIMDEDGNTSRKVVPNMKIDSCDCA